MSQHNPLVYHKMAFSLVQHQIFLSALVLDKFNVDQEFFKNIPIYSDVIHVDLHNVLHHVTKNTELASLECGRGIALTEGHSSISISPKWTGEGSLLLVFCRDLYLKVA